MQANDLMGHRGTLFVLGIVTTECRTQLAAIAELLGRRRYRIAKLVKATDVEPSVREISSRLRIPRSTVHRDLQVIRDTIRELREARQAIANGTACPFPSPSLN